MTHLEQWARHYDATDDFMASALSPWVCIEELAQAILKDRDGEEQPLLTSLQDKPSVAESSDLGDIPSLVTPSQADRVLAEIDSWEEDAECGFEMAGWRNMRQRIESILNESSQLTPQNIPNDVYSSNLTLGSFQHVPVKRLNPGDIFITPDLEVGVVESIYPHEGSHYEVNYRDQAKKKWHITLAWGAFIWRMVHNDSRVAASPIAFCSTCRGTV